MRIPLDQSLVALIRQTDGTEPCFFNPELFQPNTEDDPRIPYAKSECGECALRLECLATALHDPEAAGSGIWGGLTQGERKQLLARKEGVVSTAKVILFKPNGKYYTEEEWRIPTREEARAQSGFLGGDMMVPYCMKYSPDFRRISGGAVLVETQEPWGYPHLFPGVVTS